MKRLLILFGAILMAAAINAQTIELFSGHKGISRSNDQFSGFEATFSFDQIESVTITGTERGTFSALTIAGAYQAGEIGTPELPVFRKMIQIPVGATPHVLVKNFTSEEFDLETYGFYPVFPTQPSVRKDQTEIPFIYDEKAYGIDDYNYSVMAEVEILGQMRGIILGMVTIRPLQYNPVAHTIIAHNDIEIEVNFKGGDYKKTEELFVNTFSPHFLKHYEIAFNSGVTRDVYDDHPDLFNVPVRMLVVANRMFETTLQPWIEWKTQKGFIMDVNYTDVIGTTAAAIKTFIHNKYNTGVGDGTAPTFIILVGDTPQVPASQTGSYTSKATDLYYARTASSGFFPDMYYSRMSAQTTQQLANQIEKILYYEKYQFADPTYLDNVLLIAGADGTWNPRVGKPQIDYATNYYYNTANGYASIHKYWNAYSGCYTHLNNVGFANYTAHCNETLWGDPSFTVAQIATLTNVNKYFVAMGNCCLAADFGYSGNGGICFGEAMMSAQQKGAVGYIGSSPSSYWGEDFHFTVGAYSGNLETVTTPTLTNTTTGCYDFMFRDVDFNTLCSHVLGGNLAVQYAHNNPGYTTHVSAPYYWEAYNVLGDGSLMPYNGQAAVNTVSHLPIVPIGMNEYEVSAVPGSYVAISKDGILHGVGLADALGVAAVQLDPPILSGGDVDIVVTRNQYQPYMIQIPAAALEGPYIVYDSYETVNESALTYISENSEIAVTLKNVGNDPTEGPLSVVVSCDDPQITINNTTAQVNEIIQDGETAVVNFNVSIDNAIVDKKVFPVTVTITQDDEIWESTMRLTAYAPKFSLEKVLINGVEGGNLEAGEIVTITAVIENKGGADAYNVVGDIGINSPYVNPACDEVSGTAQDMPLGESLNFDFVVITDSNMPFGHEASLAALLTANYGITYSEVFTASNTGSSNYCIPTSSYGCNSNDKFTLVKLTKVSDGTILINHDPGCNSAPNGYIDYTNIVVPIEPGEQYLINLTVGTGGTQHIKGWFDLNANNNFETSEMLFSGSCSSGGSTSYTFTAPQDFTPGNTRFRLRCQYSSLPTDGCSSNTWGQTLDYTIVLPELYPRPENVVAQLIGANITINWDEPESEDYTPIGYDIYRLNTQLNTTLLTETTYTDEGITEGVYAYNVVAVYAGNKESFAQMSNVICFSVPCERPIEVTGTIIDETTVHITWDDSENYEGELLGYNIYRDDIKLNEELLDVQEYYDDNLIGGTYIYKVSSSYDHCIESAPSDGLTIVIAAQFCETPLNLEVTAEQYTNTAVLTWDAPEIIDGTLLGYNIYRDGAKIIERAPTDRFYNDENLENGTYIYKVSAVYEHCAESGTTEEELITIFVPLYCETVADFTANVIPYTNAAKLNWNEPENFDMPILNYRVFKDGTLFGTLPSTIFEVLVPGLSDGTHYFEVNVIYDHCTSEKTELIEVEVYVPQLCDAPEDFSVEVEENDNNAFITWTEPEEIDGDLFGYNIYRNGVVINEDLIEELEYIDIDLPTGTYTYKVAAVYGHCEALLDGDGIVVEILLGISREVTNSFTMYPNPTNGSVTITGDQLTRIEIYDVQGRKYAEYTNIKGILHIDDLKKYDSGIYLVKMYSENNQAIIQRLTIIK